ncbi:MAG: hypothetical protein WBM53_07450 [Maribacter sp.]
MKTYKLRKRIIWLLVLVVEVFIKKVTNLNSTTMVKHKKLH